MGPMILHLICLCDVPAGMLWKYCRSSIGIGRGWIMLKKPWSKLRQPCRTAADNNVSAQQQQQQQQQPLGPTNRQLHKRPANCKHRTSSSSVQLGYYIQCSSLSGRRRLGDSLLPCRRMLDNQYLRPRCSAAAWSRQSLVDGWMNGMREECTLAA